MSQRDLESTLFPSGTDFDESSRRLLFEQYRMFVETSERLVARRQTVNAFFLSVNTLLLSAIGFIFQPAFGADGWSGSLAALLGLCAAGILAAYAWRRMVASFRQLNAGKFAVIDQLERHLPAALFRAEWAALGAGTDKKRYVPFTTTEGRLTIGFGAAYLALATAGALFAFT